MSASGKIFLFILLLPFLTAAGHDVYYSYWLDEDNKRQVERLNIDPDVFQMSDLGWIWDNYSPDTMQMTRDNVEAEIWKEKVDPVLQYPTMLVAIVPFIIGVIYCIFARLLGVWPFVKIPSRFTSKEDDYAIYKHAKSKSINYSRK